MVALVTGASGFLGGAISDRLEAAGLEVRRTGRPQLEIPSPEFDELLNETAPDLLVHCAAPASVPASVEDPATDRQGSAGVLGDLLERVRGLPSAPRFLLLSSAAVYGDPASLPISEQQELRPVSPYGRHRAECEELLRDAAGEWGLEAATMRIFSAYGPGLERQILWDATQKGIRDGRIELMGTGRESRDFIHAEDVAAAALAITEGGEFGGESYNVASGVETTIAELAGLIASALELGEDAVGFDGSSRPGDPINWRADISKLEALGFSPAVAIEDGVRDYVEWVQGRA